MKFKKMLAIFLSAALFVTAFAGCGKKKADGITVQIGPNPETLDPALNSAVDGGNMLITLFETLLIIDQDNKVQPGQAEKYEVSPDGLTWTFTMRDGLKWSDGTELNAKDFEYTFKRIADTNVAAPYAKTVIGMIEGYKDAIDSKNPEKLNVKASDDGKTLTIKLAYPCSYFDKIVAFGTMSPVQKATVEKNGDSWATKPETYVCNGPYTITEWTPSEKIVCKKNENYKGGWDSSKIVNDKLTFLLLEDSSASYTAYTGGTAQLIKDVPTEEIPTLKKDKKDEFNVDPILGTYYLSMNLNKAPFNNKNVRKALSLAIDRDYVANTVMQGTYTPAYNYVGTGVDDVETGKFLENSKAANGGKTYISEDYKANLEEAKKALAEAGYPEGKGFPTITYSTNDAGYHKALAEYLQQVYKDLGITMNIDIVDWSSFTPKRRAGEYEMARNGWVMDYNDASNMIELFYSSNGNNDGKYNNPAFDKAMNDSKVADKTAHFAALHEAEKIVSEDYGFIPVAYYNDFWLQSTSLKGTWHSPYGYWYLQYAYIAD
jgi:oligopeptide transport system substrate-binding protein